MGYSYKYYRYLQVIAYTYKLFFFFKKKYGPIPASFSFIFVLFTSQINYKLEKAQTECLGFEPGAADETTELWQPPYPQVILIGTQKYLSCPFPFHLVAWKLFCWLGHHKMSLDYPSFHEQSNEVVYTSCCINPISV